ncbi:MAG: type IV pilus secretin PilQ [Burkholderiales bacterium]|nr:type IV pilus secretin PilQ [Burkholderiales bacterium]
MTSRTSSILSCTRALLIFSATCLLLLPNAALSQSKNVLESVSATSMQGGKVVVRMNFKQPLSAVPPGFTVTNPPRIAIDLPNVSNGTGKSTIEVAEGDVRSASIVEVNNRTRVVLNLARSLNYAPTIEANSLLVAIDGPAVSSTKPSGQVTQFAEATPGDNRQSLKDIDFRRGNGGEGRIIVDLSSATTGIDIRLQGKSILVDFINTSVPKNLVRRLDVADFGTPVRTVDTLDQGANTRMTVEPRGLWEYSAYQTDTQFILEVKPVKEDPNKLVQGTTPGYAGEKLSLNFQNVEVRAVLQVIADFTGLNIVTSDTVGGSLTLRLKDVPWDQALDIILQSKGLGKRKNGNVVVIAPLDEIATKEKLALEASQQISELEPVRTESFVMSYAKASDVRALLSDRDQKILSKRGSATVDQRTNTLFIQDVPARLEEARRLINQLDVPVRQVQIEARIVIADDKFGRQLGARFGQQSAFNRNGVNVGSSGTLWNTVTPLTNNAINAGSAGAVTNSFQPGGGAQPEQLNVNLPVIGAAGQLALTFLNLGSGNIVNIELSALEADNRGKVVSNPRVITADKRKAVIGQGTEIPFLTASASGATTVQFKPAVLELAVTPQITPDDKIIMDLEVKKDTVGQVFAGVPSIDTRRVQTQVLVENGDTVVLGGIFEQNSRTDVVKVPVLGDIPIIGAAFRRTQKQEDKTELLIFITPKIIKDSITIR